MKKYTFSLVLAFFSLYLAIFAVMLKYYASEIQYHTMPYIKEFAALLSASADICAALSPILFVMAIVAAINNK